MSSNVMLFACSKCFSKHPFDELSSGQQLCKECRGYYIKCTYCRSEFNQTKLSTNSICGKCEANVKQFGKPSACEYCNIIAAFIGNKCQRCTNSERKFGAPVTCEQCKQKCAFDRKDDDKKVQVVDGKLLCWLCTLSYKRALAKTKHTSESERRAQMKISTSQRPNDKRSRESSGSRPGRSSGSKRSSSQRSSDPKLESGLDLLPPVAKAMRSNRPPGDILDPNSSDHVVAMTQLKEQMASLQKQITQKDAQLLSKDKMICELKAKHFTNETELRGRMQSTERDFEKKVETLSHKIKTLQKEVATLTKSNKAKGRTKQVEKEKKEEEASASGPGSGGSGTDSPLP